MPTTQPWKPTLDAYATPSLGRGVLALLTSIVPYLGLCAASLLTLGTSPWFTAALEILSGGFLIRVFVMFHDCTHGSLFPSRKANQRVGFVLGLLVLAPFTRWRHDHAVHHASAGDLDRRGVGDIVTLTVAEYRALTPRAQLAYRINRNPLVMFGVGPIVAMIIGPRIPAKGAKPRMRRSVLLTDAVLAVLFVGLAVLVGPLRLLLVWAPGAMIAGAGGIWLFYVQHQFEGTYWERGGDWRYEEAALRGSSYLKLPRILAFFTANIGLHHVHHLNARIPNYRLQAAHDAYPPFASVPTLTLWDGLRAVRLKLWDESSGRLVTFAEARALPAETDVTAAAAAAA